MNETDLSITKQDSTAAGSCNACRRYTTGDGITSHPVAQIDLRSVSFRLCAPCLAVLKERLESFKL